MSITGRVLFLNRENNRFLVIIFWFVIFLCQVFINSSVLKKIENQQKSLLDYLKIYIKYKVIRDNKVLKKTKKILTIR